MNMNMNKQCVSTIFFDSVVKVIIKKIMEYL